MANEAQASTVATRPKSTRNKNGVYKSAIVVLMAKERESAAGTSSSSKGESGAPAPGENFSPLSDDDMTLSSEADGRSNGETPALPFAKTSPIWEMVESLEIFQKIPQTPHFRPPSSSNELMREGLAIAAMVNCSALVEKISKFDLNEPASLLEDYMETLSELETHGFLVEPMRKRVHGLRSIKTTYDECQAISRELLKEKDAMSVADEEIEDMDEQIQRLEHERSVAEAERAAKDNEIRALQLQFDEDRDEFERVANAPW